MYENSEVSTPGQEPITRSGQRKQPSNFPVPVLGRSLPVLFTSKIRDCEEGIVIQSFFTWFPFLTWVWVNILLEITSLKQDGKNSHFSIRCEKLARKREPVWDQRLQSTGVGLTPKVWELAGICTHSTHCARHGLSVKCAMKAVFSYCDHIKFNVTVLKPETPE